MLTSFPENKEIDFLDIFEQILVIISRLIFWILTRNDHQKIFKGRRGFMSLFSKNGMRKRSRV